MIRRDFTGSHLNLFRTLFLGVLFLCFSAAGTIATAQSNSGNALPGKLSPGQGWRSAAALHGEPLHSGRFQHFPYADPGALKGGTVTIGRLGEFKSLEPQQAEFGDGLGVADTLHDPLMARARDEAFSVYPLIAEAIDMPADRSWVAFRIDADAKFSDGSPITLQDIEHSFRLARNGAPEHQAAYRAIDKIAFPEDRVIWVLFRPGAPADAAFRLAQTRIVPSAAEAAPGEPVTSGPYRVERFDPSAELVLARNPDYWARNLPSNRGRHNFDRIRILAFEDADALFDAFKTGRVTVLNDNDPGRWASAYDFPAAFDGRILRNAFEHRRPKGFYGLVFNLRRNEFSDPRVRRALTLAFDFEWINANLLHDAYVRTRSYHANTDFAAPPAPAATGEVRALGPFADFVDAEILRAAWTPPRGGAGPAMRANLREALGLLSAAGWRPDGGRLIGDETGEPFEFEIPTTTDEETRVIQAYAGVLRRIGLNVTVSQIGREKLNQRIADFDFDMAPYHFEAGFAPSPALASRFSQMEADRAGSLNLPGLRNPAVDSLAKKISDAPRFADSVDAARALDRVLLSGYYAVPLYHAPRDRIAWWSDIQHPEVDPSWGYLSPKGALQLDTWWSAATN